MLFSYKCLDKNKKTIEGTAEAVSEQELAGNLKKKGLLVVGIGKAKIIKETGDLPAIEKIVFCRYLSTMIAAGLSLNEGVEVLSSQTRNSLTKKILSQLSFDLAKGETLSSILSKYPSCFDEIFLTLVKAGEASGTLSESFSYLADQLKNDYNVSRKIKGALLYPAIIFLTMTAVGLIMLIFVVPKIGGVFLNLKIALPFSTYLLLMISFFLKKYFFAFLGVFFLFVFFAFWFFQRPQGKFFLKKAVSRTPLLKNLLILFDLTRFNRTLGILLRSGVPITQSLRISFGTLLLPGFKNLASFFEEQINKGIPLSQILSLKPVFPAFMAQMIAGGEKSGTLDKSLNDLAGFYDEELDNSLKNFVQILEPVLMIIVGIAVAVMVLSIIAPIYSLTGGMVIK